MVKLQSGNQNLRIEMIKGKCRFTKVSRTIFIRSVPEVPLGLDIAISNLSNYGTNSLSFNQKDIFNKQNSRYNIINVKPKDYDDSIRQFPKFTLENKD
jgi:hypothetical protein